MLLFDQPLNVLYLSSFRVYAWQVDLGNEGDIGWNVGILLAAMNLQAIDSVLMYALSMKSASAFESTEGTYMWRS